MANGMGIALLIGGAAAVVLLATSKSNAAQNGRPFMGPTGPKPTRDDQCDANSLIDPGTGYCADMGPGATRHVTKTAGFPPRRRG